MVICMNDTDRWRYAEFDSQSDAAYRAPMGMTLLTYSFLGIFSRLVVPTTLTMIVATEVQNTMCQRVSAIGYLNPEYARMYCGRRRDVRSGECRWSGRWVARGVRTLLNRITPMEIVIQMVT